MPEVNQTAVHWSDAVLAFAATYGLSLAGGIIILIVGWKAADWSRRIVTGVLSRTRKVDPTIGQFLASLTRYAILGFTILAVLDRFGIQTASIIAMLGAAGLAIGLALQGTLSNIAAGIMLMLFRPFKVGDHVEVAAHSGTVRGVDLFVTELVTEDNLQVLIPNTKVWGDSIVNRSRYSTRRIEVPLPVASADVDRALDIAERTTGGTDGILSDPKPEVVTSDVSGKTMTVLVRAWCRSGDHWRVRADLIRRLRAAFDQAEL